VNRYSPLRTGRTGFQIDEADRAIVLRLQRDCRASFRELGDAAGLSPSGARLRFERLVRHGALKVVGIPVRSGRSGTPTLGVGIRTGGRVAALLPKIKALDPEFLAVTVGGYDFIATISADTAGDLLATMDALRGLEDITTIDSWANLQIAKEQYGQGDRLAAHPATASRARNLPNMAGDGS
jgi:DNA-binding Lrp family transcriptional regulator